MKKYRFNKGALEVLIAMDDPSLDMWKESYIVDLMMMEDGHIVMPDERGYYWIQGRMGEMDMWAVDPRSYDIDALVFEVIDDEEVQF